MGKKSTPKTPAPPDPREIAQTDAEFNRIDQYTPFGSLTFGGDNRNQATLEFSPELQGLFDSRIGLDQSLLDAGQGQLGNLSFNGIDLSGFGPIQSDAGLQNDAGLLKSAGLRNDAGLQGDAGLTGVNAPGTAFDPSAFGLGPGQLPQFQNSLDLSGLPEIPTNFNQLRQDQEDAFFQRGRRLLEPQFERQEDRLRQTLANQGLFAGDEAAGDQFQIFGENRNRAFQDLADQSILRGGQEAGNELARILGTRQQGFGEALGAGQFNNQAGLNQLNAGLSGFGAAGQGLSNQLATAGFNNQAAQQGLQNLNFANQQGFQNFNQAQQQGLQNFNAAQQQGLQNFNQAQQQELLNSNAGRLQGLQEALGLRGNQFNELASLLGLQQTATPGLQNFFGPGQTDFLGASALQQQQLNNNFAAQTGTKNAGMGGLFGLGSALGTAFINR
jgi:hypothetical protein